jgi:hypothetical protein
MAVGNIIYSSSSTTIASGDVIHAADFERSTKLQVDDVSGNLNITGGINTGSVSNLGSVSNVKISGGSNGQVLRTDGSSNLSWTTPLTMATAVSASGTAVDFTSIPAGIKRITILLNGVSTNGSSPVTVQIGDSGGIETSSYAGSVWGTLNATTGFVYSSTAFYLDPNSGDSVISRIGTAVLQNINGNTWILNSNLMTIGGIAVGTGAKTLSGTLDRIRLTTIGGINTFDAGTVNIMYE